MPRRADDRADGRARCAEGRLMGAVLEGMRAAIRTTGSATDARGIMLSRTVEECRRLVPPPTDEVGAIAYHARENAMLSVLETCTSGPEAADVVREYLDDMHARYA